jgi:hypothetical protein
MTTRRPRLKREDALRMLAELQDLEGRLQALRDGLRRLVEET